MLPERLAEKHPLTETILPVFYSFIPLAFYFKWSANGHSFLNFENAWRWCHLFAALVSFHLTYVGLNCLIYSLNNTKQNPPIALVVSAHSVNATLYEAVFR